jgi:Firmicute plasmid replication protein (RepL)
LNTFPCGSLPGEVVGTYAHIPGQTWLKLRLSDPKFLENWKSPHLSRAHHLTVSCITRGVPTDEMVTLIRIWHNKHGHGFYEDEFWKRTFPGAAQYASPIVMRYQANKYWEEVRRISSDLKARQHSKLRVAYYLMNTSTATAREIHDMTGISLKTVRNCILALQRSGKVEMDSYGIYRADQGFYWDRVNVAEGTEGRYTWDEDHAAMYSFVAPNTFTKIDGVWEMGCYDYCRDQFRVVTYDANQKFRPGQHKHWASEWVINSKSEVVENGSGVPFTSVFPGFEGTPGIPLKLAAPV